MVAACGGDRGPDPVTAVSPSAGQVGVEAPAQRVTRFAAARFLEQTTFGVKAADVDRVRAVGFEAWIDEQIALPVTQFDGRLSIERYADASGRQEAYRAYQDEFFAAVLSRPDQLRQRVAWSLSQFVVVSLSAGDPYGVLEYHNLLLRHAFGAYGSFLRAMTVNPAMGAFLDNGRNRAATACEGCSPNENFARELMQLFSVGVNQLNPDGSLKRDARGRALETYTQRDVAELARALTGWEFILEPRLPNGNLYNYGKPMRPGADLLHDFGSKTVMGTTFPAGQTAEQDLDRVVAMLMSHPNTAPFVSLRLIQHLVTSDPTPAYVGRVAAVFRNNGRGAVGDLVAVVKAVLLDPEARRGDAGHGESARFGKLREPMLFQTALLRGLGCARLPVSSRDRQRFVAAQQEPLFAPSVFSFYLPTDKAPGSNLLAPEQRLLTGEEMRSRVSSLRHWTVVLRSDLDAAGCDLQSLAQAAARSPGELAVQIGERWFRGAMPPALHRTVETLWANQPGHLSAEARVANVLGIVLSSPAFGTLP